MLLLEVYPAGKVNRPRARGCASAAVCIEKFSRETACVISVITQWDHWPNPLGLVVAKEHFMKLKSHRQLLFIVLLLVILLSGSGGATHAQGAVGTMQLPSTTPTPLATLTVATPTPAVLARKVIELTNLERVSAGLPPLKENAMLNQAARAHSLAMAERDFFDHTDPVTGSTPGERARAAGYLWNLIGENIGQGYQTPEEAVIGWISSQRHRENMLNPDYREIGVGFVLGSGQGIACQHPPCQYYWTQNFGVRGDYFPVVINDEALVTTSPQVTLYIYGQGWAQDMRLRNDAGSFSSWEPFSTLKNWQLPTGDGLHAVSVELRNAAGEIRSASDEIHLTTSPTPSAGQIPSSQQHQPTVSATSILGGSQPFGSDVVQLERQVNPVTVLTGQEVQVTFQLTGNSGVCGEQIVRTPLDIALVIDHSGSMSDMAGPGQAMSKLEAAQQAALAFLQAIELGTDWVTVIGFSSRAQLLQELDARIDKLSTAISSLGPGGGTNIADGLLAALDELTSERHRQEASGVIILLSDGQSPAQDAAQQAKSAGLRVVTIGLGTDVEETELRSAASSPGDYYSSPDANQLEAIFLDVARSIREVPAATDLTLTHRFDVTNFEVIEDSVTPQGQVAFDRIIWQLPTLIEEPIRLTYRARVRVPGEFDLALGDALTYRRCGQDVQTTTLDSGLPVTVQLDPYATPTPIITPVPEPMTPTERALNLVCGDFPWWLLLPLMLFLTTLILIVFANLGGCRRKWTLHRQHPLLCLLASLLWLAYIYFLLALLLRELQPVFCQPRAAIYYWQVTPDGDSAILYKPIEPDLPVREFQSLNQRAECIACHDTALEADVIAAIADGSNGPVTVMHLDGTPVSIPPITASYLALSPDGRQLAYAYEGKDIYIMDIESGTTVPLVGASDPGVVETMPAWSPDGQIIAFVRALGEVRGYTLAVPCDIYTVPAGGGTATLLPGAGGSGFNYYPAYSPDGRWLAFTRHTTGGSTRADPQAEIYIVPAQGGQAQRLAANDLPGGQSLVGASNSWPTWSLDGRFLAFNTKRSGGQFDIFVTQIDPEGNSGPARPLPGASRFDRFEHLPKWGRPPRVNLLARLFRLLPWLLPLLLLWLLRRWLCRWRKYPHTVSLAREVTPDSGYVNEQVFNVRLTLTGDNSTCDEIRMRKPVDVLLVLDVSGSMSESARPGLRERKLDGAKAAGQAFINRMDLEQDRIGLIAFNDTAQALHSLDAETEPLRRAIEELGCGGGTAIHEGLSAALDELQTFGRAGAARAIVLLSDGGSAAEPALAQAQAIGGQGIRLITVGFGKDADREMLRQLATTPQDSHFSASNRQLEQAFLSIAEQILEPLAATDVRFSHRINLEAFELDEGSIYPRPQNVEEGVIVWRLADLGVVPRSFRYRVIGKKAGEAQNVDWGDVIQYRRCGDLAMELLEGPGLPVSVNARPEPGVVKRIAKPPEPLPIPPLKSVWEPDAVMVLGTGTFGRQVLTHLKKNLRDAGAGVIPGRVQFLLVDTAKYLATGKPLRFAGVALDDAEVMVLDENLRPVVQQMLGDAASHPELRPWFPAQSYTGATQTQTLAEGTHGERPIARAGLLRLVSGKARVEGRELFVRLKKALEAVNIPPHGVRLVLVGSLSEGMGAILWDLAYLAREATRQHLGADVPVAVEGYFGLEIHRGVNEPVEDAELNALVALRELTWLQLNPGFPYRFGYGDDALDEGLIPLRARLIDDLYLFITGLGAEVQSSWPAVADLITLRLDRQARRFRDRDWYDIRRQDVAKREASQRALFFGTGNSFAIRLPAYDLIEMVKVRWAREVIQGFLMGERRETLVFSSEYMDDPGLPPDPAALVDVFLGGFERGDQLYQVDTAIPSSVRCLGLVAASRVHEAAKHSCAVDSVLIRSYLTATLKLLLMGTDDPRARQPRAGKIAYASEFLEALKLKGEGPLRQAIAQAPVSMAVRNTWEEAYKALLAEVEAALIGLNQTKTYLGEVYGALVERERELGEWRREMENISSRLYIWQKLVGPQGELLAQPEELAELWYEVVYQSARPEAHAPYMIWGASTKGSVDLQLLLAEGQRISSSQTTPEQFSEHLLEFANAQVQTLWDQASLAAVAGHATARVAERLRTPTVRYQSAGLAQMAQLLRRQAQAESQRRDSLLPAAWVERNVLAVCKPTGEELSALIDAFPQPSGDTHESTEWDWPRLSLSDRLSWQLLHTLDVLTPSMLRRYSRVLERLVGEDKQRAVFDWEAMAKYVRGRYNGELLHPVVAAALVDEARAHLYGLAWASGWVVQADGGWAIRPELMGEPLVTWTSAAGWDGDVYGLLYFVYRATGEQMDEVGRRLEEHVSTLRERWLKMSQREAFTLRQPGDGDDRYALRLLAWYAARKRIGELNR